MSRVSQRRARHGRVKTEGLHENTQGSWPPWEARNQGKGVHKPLSCPLLGEWEAGYLSQHSHFIDCWAKAICKYQDGRWQFWGRGECLKTEPSPSKEIESFPCTVKSKRMGPRGLYSSDSMGGSPHRTRRNCKQLSSSSLSLHRPIIGY